MLLDAGATRSVDGRPVHAFSAPTGGPPHPVYDASYQAALITIRRFLDELPNLQVAGRNGMHRYNNQDHSMVTGMVAAANVLGARLDQWGVNVDESYHEGAGQARLAAMLVDLGATQPEVPRLLAALRDVAGRSS